MNPRPLPLIVGHAMQDALQMTLRNRRIRPVMYGVLPNGHRRRWSLRRKTTAGVSSAGFKLVYTHRATEIAMLFEASFVGDRFLGNEIWGGNCYNFKMEPNPTHAECQLVIHHESRDGLRIWIASVWHGHEAIPAFTQFIELPVVKTDGSLTNFFAKAKEQTEAN